MSILRSLSLKSVNDLFVSVLYVQNLAVSVTYILILVYTKGKQPPLWTQCDANYGLYPLHSVLLITLTELVYMYSVTWCHRSL